MAGAPADLPLNAIVKYPGMAASVSVAATVATAVTVTFPAPILSNFSRAA